MVARLAELSDITVPSALADLKNKERRFTGSIEKSDMNSYVMKRFWSGVMALFVIGDLHLALSVSNKKMDIFGGWENYMELLEKNWNEHITSEDTVVLAGDSSWAMNIRDAYEDFCWIEKMPGKKILLKGNHDYWWCSRKKNGRYFFFMGIFLSEYSS